MVNEYLAYSFTFDSGSSLGNSDGNEARKNRKLVLLSKEDLYQWNKIKSKVLVKILYAKFSQVKEANFVLLATLDAELWHRIRRVKAERQ